MKVRLVSDDFELTPGQVVRLKQALRKNFPNSPIHLVDGGGIILFEMEGKHPAFWLEVTRLR